jgi:hypothetical protein
MYPLPLGAYCYFWILINSNKSLLLSISNAASANIFSYNLASSSFYYLLFSSSYFFLASSSSLVSGLALLTTIEAGSLGNSKVTVG